MQTFLPSRSFYASVNTLDNKRLGKERVEAKQLLAILLEKRTTGAWVNHPALLMWKGYECALAAYMNECIYCWCAKGFRNTMKYWHPNRGFYFSNNNRNEWLAFPYISPLWLGNEKLHSSHRAALLYKNYAFYSQYRWGEEPTLNYWWPTKNGY
jgi:hypothetical protein